MRNALFAWFSIEPSEAMYRNLTVEHAKHLREGKAHPEDTTIDPMIRTAAEKFNARWFLVIPALRLPKLGYFAKEVEARSDLER